MIEVPSKLKNLPGLDFKEDFSVRKAPRELHRVSSHSRLVCLVVVPAIAMMYHILTCLLGKNKVALQQSYH